VSYEETEDIKLSAHSKDLFGDLNHQWTEFYDHVMTLGFDEKPSYNFLISLLESLMLDEDDDIDMVFDWMNSNYIKGGKDSYKMKKTEAIGQAGGSSDEREQEY
jgi:hypothetical protein